MENNTLGKRIKEARLAKKMTQSEVVGDFITRNMLSQIESGSATPSVKTLEYLCKVLEIEPNALLPDENDSKNAPDAEGYIRLLNFQSVVFLQMKALKARLTSF